MKLDNGVHLTVSVPKLNETMKTISLTNIHYDGTLGSYSTDKTPVKLNGVSCELEFGKSYLLGGEGSWALSWIIAGALSPASGDIYLDGERVAQSDMRRISWLVRYDEIKKFGLFHQSVKSQIRTGIRNRNHSFALPDEQEIMQRFYLTPERYNRPSSQLSNEAWRASCAIGLANQRNIMCFPLMRSDFIDEYRSLWLEDILSYLKSFNVLVIMPAQFTAGAEGLFDKVIKPTDYGKIST